MSHITHSHENWRQILSAGKMKQDKISFGNKKLSVYMLGLSGKLRIVVSGKEISLQIRKLGTDMR